MKLSFKNIAVAAIAAAFSLFISAQSVSAASTNVTVAFNGLHFSPTNVLISLNDSVIWTWAATGHSCTSGTNDNHGDDNGVPSGLWDTGIQSSGHVFTNTFTSAGTFSYYCTPHAPLGMTGQVFVVGASLPPSLAISKPLPGTVFAAPANVAIQASVTNGSAPVTNVEFLANATVLANETAGPFAFTNNNVGVGSYTLTAIAEDSSGLTGTNSVAISVVTPVAVSLTNIFKLSGTNFQFTYPANIGLNYVVQRSTNLFNWVSLATNMASSNPVVFVDLSATNSPNFYRVGRLPNP